MKRLLSVVLVLLVAIVPMAAVASQEREPVEHLLWDIPFGIGVEECLALVKERFGVEVPYSHDSERSVTYVAESEQGVTLYGHPVEFWVKFVVPEDELRFLELWVFDDEWSFHTTGNEDGVLVPEGFTRAVREAIGVNRELQNLYGAPTGGWMLVGEKKEDMPRDYFLPMRNGLLDEVLAEEILMRFGPPEDGVVLCVFYDNVKVWISAHTTRIWQDEVIISIFMHLKYSAMGNYNMEEAYSFEATNGEHQNPKLDEME